MRHLAPVTTVALLALATSACGSGDAGGGRDSAMVGGKGLDVCGLVSDDTVTAVQTASGSAKVTPVESLMRGSELFVECRIVVGVDVGFAVRGAPGGPPLESLVEGRYGDAAEPLTGVGDEARVGTNSYDGVRVTVRVGDQELVVNSNAYVSPNGGGVSRDVVVDLAKEVASNLGSEKPAAVRMPKTCPPTTDPEVEAAVGTTVLARGAQTSNGSVTCGYVSDTRTARLAAVSGNAGMNLMAPADSDEGDRSEVDGDPALYDNRDGVSVFAGDECVLGASASPVGWGLADPRPEPERRAALVELVTFVKETIGCP